MPPLLILVQEDDTLSALFMPDNQPKQTKNNRWEKLTLTAVSCAVVIVFVVLGIMAIPRKDKDDSSHSANDVSAKLIIDDLSTKLQGETLRIKETSPKNGLTATGHIAYSASYYGAGEFQTLPDRLYGVAVQGSLDMTNSDYEGTVAYMIAKGFTEHESYIGQEGETFLRQASYQSDSVVCHVSQVSLVDTQIGNLAVGVGCADTSSYARTASIVKPFYDAFADANPEQSKGLYIAAPDINNGKDGYKNAIVLIDDFAALFYKQPNSDWQYFTSVEQMPFCSFYNTTVLRKSFSGQPCYDLDKQKQVTL